MDHVWTPKSSRPTKLYRVYRPRQYTTLSHRGLQASDPKAILPFKTHFLQFIKSITDHRMQSPSPSPYISFFSSRSEAEEWTLAAEEVFQETAYVLELDLTHKKMQGVIMWRVQDIQDKTGQKLGLGGVRNSEWLALWQVPSEAIKREYKSSADIRLERGMPFPKHVQDPNTARADFPIYNELLFVGPYSNVDLICGCENEEKCIHFHWPTESGARKDRSMKRLQAGGGGHVPGGLRCSRIDSAIDISAEAIQVPGGQAVPTDKRSSEDSGVAMGNGEGSAGQPISVDETP
ncbi:hypothetical protein V8E51_004137 [Hyaloscypha variabilis]